VFEEPTEEQQLALDLVAGIYLQHRRWPAWVWLDEQLERRGLNGAAVFTSFPREFSVGYSPIGPRREPAPSPDNQIWLTIAGLKQANIARDLVSATLMLIDALGTGRQAIHLDPFNGVPPSLTRDIVFTNPLLAARVTLFGAMPIEILGREPATWHCRFSPATEDWESVELSPAVRRFAGVQSSDDYMERLALMLSHSEVSDPQSGSPFPLPDAIDYLDAVWHRRFQTPLVQAPGVARSAKLAGAASNSDEAATCLSALAELLKGLRLTGTPGDGGGHSLDRLEPFLDSNLPEESRERVHDAIATLNAARKIRAGSQHVSAQSQALEAFALLKIGFPVYDWPRAWQQVQAAVAHAFDVIREELQASMP
jgi:hypothetical protein